MFFEPAVLLFAGSLCQPSGAVLLRHSGDYGPGGNGTSFSLQVDMPAKGDVLLGSHRWIVPDGVYRGTLLPEDRQLLDCLMQDLKEGLPSPPPFWHCPHAPDFQVVTFSSSPGDNLITTVCISRVSESPLASPFHFVRWLIPRACWVREDPRGPR